MDEIPLPYETLFLVCTNRREDGRAACGPAGGDALCEQLKRLVKERRAAGSLPGSGAPTSALSPVIASPPLMPGRPAGVNLPTEARRARVSSTGCLGCCADGPTVVVFPGGERYARVRTEDLPGILDRYVPGEA